MTVHDRPQVFVHPERPTPERIDPVTNARIMKPEGGLWTSSLKANGDGPPTCGWIEWMNAERWFRHGEDARAWVLQPDPDATVYRIDSPTDLQALVSEFPAESDVPRILDPKLDYEAVAEVYAGIWLTAQGQRLTRFSQPSLYGWDCESTLWFGWHFEGEPVELDAPVRRTDQR